MEELKNNELVVIDENTKSLAITRKNEDGVYFTMIDFQFLLEFLKLHNIIK